MAKDRITDRHLKALCSEANRLFGTPETAYTHRDGQLRANVGHYHLDVVYGGVSIVQMGNESGGVHVVISRGTRREVYDRFRAYLDGARAGKVAGSIETATAGEDES